MTPEELKTWRDEHKLQQSELAEMLGVHMMTVWSWENGRQKISPFLYLALEALSQRLLTSPPDPPEPAKTHLRRVK